MKKGLILLPLLVAGLVVTGCEKKGGNGGGEEGGIPASGKGYYVWSDSDDGKIYLDGNMVATYYLGTTDTKSSAITFEIETNGDFFTLKAENGVVAGKYLALVVSGSKVNTAYQSSAFEFTWHEEELDEGTYGGYGAQLQSGEYNSWYLLGNQPGYTTISTVFKKYWSTNYLARISK